MNKAADNHIFTKVFGVVVGAFELLIAIGLVVVEWHNVARIHDGLVNFESKIECVVVGYVALTAFIIGVRTMRDPFKGEKTNA